MAGLRKNLNHPPTLLSLSPPVSGVPLSSSVLYLPKGEINPVAWTSKPNDHPRTSSVEVPKNCHRPWAGHKPISQSQISIQNGSMRLAGYLQARTYNIARIDMRILLV